MTVGTSPTRPLLPQDAMVTGHSMLQGLAVLTLCVISGCVVLAEDEKLPTIPEVDWNQVGQDTLRAQLKVMRNHNVAKNAILFLGDGMGLTTVTAGRIMKGQMKGKPGEEEVLEFDKFPSVGLAKTYAVDWQVAQSAETATAYLCGVKSKFRTIGMTQKVVEGDCTTMEGNEATSNLITASKEGKATGIVTNTRITHASPANVYAHVANRYWERDSLIQEEQKKKCPKLKDIAAQLLENGLDIEVVMGGGRRNFLPSTKPDPEYAAKMGGRADGRDLIQEWLALQKEKGKTASFVWNATGLDAVSVEKTDRLLGLFEYSHMKYDDERRADTGNTPKDPSLTEMVEKALKILKKNENGYFLFVEGGRIDHAHHESWGKRALVETVEFEKAIKKALDMTSSSDTLILVTADHSVPFTIQGHPKRGTPIAGLNNTPVEPALDNKTYTTMGYTNGPGYSAPRQNVTRAEADQWTYRQQPAVKTKWTTHGGEDVPVYATGPMSHLFQGVYEQNYIAHAMAYATCIGQNKEHCTKKHTPPPCSGVAMIFPNTLLIVLGTLLWASHWH